MGEYKFRAWDDIDKKWLMANDILINLDGEAYAGLSAESGIGERIKDGDIKIMQYTGLKDRNGKEIYESDILLFPCEPACIVIWGGGGFVGKEINGWDVMADYFPINHHNIIGGHIAGNVHENPELLEVKWMSK